MKSLQDELSYIFSPVGGKYYLSAFIVMFVVIILFSIFFSQNYIKDGKVVVIDLDNTAYSRELIDKIDSSPYIAVNKVYNVLTAPEEHFYHDQNIGVIYLPRGLEENRYRLRQNHIGLFLDNTNAGLTGALREGIMEVVGTENVQVGIPKVTELGVDANQAVGIIANLKVNFRMLFNSNDSSANTSVIAFMFMFPSISYTMAVLPIVARLRMTKKWPEEVAAGTSWDLVCRIFPYAAIYLSSAVLGLGLLKFLSDFRFAGNVFEFLLPMILYALSIGLVSMILTWNSPHPGVALGRMTFIIPPGFILGGATSPIALFPESIRTFSHLFPMTWVLKFVRSIGLRGAHLWDLPYEIIGFICYTFVLVGVFVFLFQREKRIVTKRS